ncbi:glycosyltransferase [bacterium]|nr:MAG: glycosyltransferase [bacterium]
MIARRFALYTPLDPGFVGGLRSWIGSFWTKYLALRDGTLDVYHTGTRPWAAVSRNSDDEGSGRIRYYRLRGRAIPGSAARIARVGELAECLSSADVLYVDNGYAFQDVVGLTAARRAGVAAISGHHSVIRSSWSHNIIWDFVGRRVVRHFNAVHVLNSDDEAYLQRLGAKGVHWVPIAIDIERYTPRERFGTFTILFVGRLHKQKGIDRLVSLIGRSREMLREGRVQFIVAGGGPELRLLETVRDVPGVRLVGAVSRSDCAELMGRSHALLMPSRSETFGIVAAEALASGLFVLASDVPGVRDVLRGTCGELIRTPDDPLAWVGALTRTVAMFEKRHDDFVRGSVEARSSVVGRFSFDSVASGFDNLVNDALTDHCCGRHVATAG